MGKKLRAQTALQQYANELGQFLDATTHLYKRSCPSVRPSVRRSVHRSVGLSVRLSRVIFERRIWPFLKVESHQMTSQTMIE